MCLTDFKKRIIKWRAKKESAIRKQPIKWYGRGQVVSGGWSQPRGITDIRKTERPLLCISVKKTKGC